MNILISGINGFIGPKAAKAFLDNGDSVRGLILKGSDESSLQDLNIEKIYADITDISMLHKAVSGIDTIIHLAAILGDTGPDEKYHPTNYEGTVNLCSAAIEAGVKRIVFLSSLSVHGLSKNNGFNDADEETPVDPDTAYSRSKAKCEKYLHDLSKSGKIETVIVRPAWTIFGSDDRLVSAKLLTSIKAKRFAYINGGNARHGFVHVESLADSIVNIARAESSVVNGEKFVISDYYLTWKEFTEIVCDKFNVSYPKINAPLWVVKIFASVYEPVVKFINPQKDPIISKYRILIPSQDICFKYDKAKNLINHIPKYTFNEALDSTIEWYNNEYADLEKAVKIL